MSRAKLPRTDIGSAGHAGLLAAFLLQLLDGKGYDFDLWAGFAGVALVFLAGYLPERHKNFIMSVVAVLSTIVASLVGLLVYGQPFDNSVLSFAIATFVVAFAGYALPPNANTEAIVGGAAAVNRGPSNPPGAPAPPPHG